VKDLEAIDIVCNYIRKSLPDCPQTFSVYICWTAKILQNWKYVLRSSFEDGVMYELTYNGDKNEWYLDTYKKISNFIIEGGDKNELSDVR